MLVNRYSDGKVWEGENCKDGGKYPGKESQEIRKTRPGGTRPELIRVR